MTKNKLLILFFAIFFSGSHFIFSQEFEIGLPIGHSKDVTSATFNQNGKLLITTSKDDTVKLWNAEIGMLIHSFDADEYLKSAIFSNDGKNIITSSFDGSITVWDLNTLKLKYQLKGNTSTGVSVVNSTDSKEILMGFDDGNVKKWNLETGKLISSFTGHSKTINTIKYNPNGKQFATLSKDNKLNIWDSQSDELITSLELNRVRRNDEFSFSKSGKFLLVSEWPNKLKIVDTNTGEIIRSLNNGPPVNKAFFSSDEEKLITVSSSKIKIWNLKTGELIRLIDDNISKHKVLDYNDSNKILIKSVENAKLLDLDTGQIINEFKGHRLSIFNGLFSPDNKKVLTTSDDKTAKLWNVENGKLIYSFENKSEQIEVTKFSIDDNLLLTVSKYSQIAKLWDITSGKLLHVFGDLNFDAIINDATIEFSSDNKYILIGHNDGSFYMYNLKTGKLIRSFKGHSDWLLSLEFSLNNKHILSSLRDGTVKVWSVESGELVNSFEGLYNNFSSNNAIFTKDGNQLLTISNDKFARLWDFQTAELIQVFEEREITSIQLSPNGNEIYSNGFTGGLFLWNLESGELINKFEGSFLEGKAVLNPKGEKALTVLGVGNDYAVSLWDVKSGKTLYKLKGHNNSIVSAFFSPDGKHVLTASKDNSIKIWNATNGNLLYTINGLSAEDENVAFSNDSKSLVVISNNGSADLYDVSSGDQILKFIVVSGKECIWLLPNSYYMASKEAASKLYYKKGLKTIGFEQLDVKYNRPDKVLEVLGDITGKRNEQLINAYKKAWEKRIRKLDIDTTSFREGFSVPESEFYNRDNITYEQSKSELKLRIKGSDNTYKLERFNVWINEVPVYGRKGISLKSRNIKSLDTTITVELSQGENRIETSILNVNGIESYRQPLYVNHTPRKEIKEKLYFVGIGVDKYQDEGNNLNYSVKDIKDLSIKLKEKYGSQIQIDTLFNQNVTVSNIKNLKEQLSKSRVDDKVIISFSGHGLLSKDLDYYLATHNVNFSSPEENGLPYEDLEYLLDGIPSRQKLLLIDACHSGEVDKEEVESIHEVEKLKEGLKGSIGVRTKKPKMGMKNSFELMKELFNNVDRATGATVISAAAGTEFAQERGNLKNGVFTYCILNQLREKETISVSELKQLVSEQVKEITNGLQQPTSRNETIENDWYVW